MSRHTVLFQSTPLMRGETRTSISHQSKPINFNPLPSCEGRRRSGRGAGHTAGFQSTPLMRGETPALFLVPVAGKFQSTPLMRGETIYRLSQGTGRRFQSTPLMRGETARMEKKGTVSHFNPLPSCEGRQHKPPKIRLDSRQFIQQNHHSSFF